MYDATVMIDGVLQEVPKIKTYKTEYYRSFDDGSKVLVENIQEYPTINSSNSVLIAKEISGQLVIVPEYETEAERDDLGFTHPNLHRRIDPLFSTEVSVNNADSEIKLGPSRYILAIQDNDSYRTICKFDYIDYQNIATIDSANKFFNYDFTEDQFEQLKQAFYEFESLEIP